MCQNMSLPGRSLKPNVETKHQKETCSTRQFSPWENIFQEKEKPQEKKRLSRKVKGPGFHDFWKWELT